MQRGLDDNEEDPEILRRHKASEVLEDGDTGPMVLNYDPHNQGGPAMIPLSVEVLAQLQV